MVLMQTISPPPMCVPSNLTVPQFLLDDRYYHITRPKRLSSTPCLIEDRTGREVFMDELRLRTQHLATAIHFNWEIHEGDVVSIMSPNHLDFPTCVWATHRIGGIVATINPALTSSELVHHLELARPSLFFVHRDCLSAVVEAATFINLPLGRLVLLDAAETGDPILYRSVDELIEEGRHLAPFVDRILDEGEAKKTIAFLAPSSGTTGVQKAVAISHYNVISILIQSATFNRLNEPYAPWSERRFRPGDVCCGFLPLYHIYGLVYNLHFMLYAGMSLVLASKFHLKLFLESIERFHITHLTIVPPQAVLLSKHPIVKRYDLSCVRYCIVAAAPMSAELTERLLEILPNAQLGQGYGLTETCGTVSMFPLSQKIGILGSGGQLLPGTEVKVINEAGFLAKDGEVGELYVRGGQVALGYYGNEKATRETFVDGWLRTGDQVMFQGRDMFIVERVKELIKVKGLQVAPAELEGHLLEHCSILDAAVIGIKDEYAGELPLAFVVLRSQVSRSLDRNPGRAGTVRASIFEHVMKSKAKHKWLEGGIIFTDRIPRNGSGKILRRVLRDRITSIVEKPRTKL
ncbi:phenylacetyl-CoA ligase [Mycena floridula]|nr:phenylacetyl-CoA ligase [Mycena floridula]